MDNPVKVSIVVPVYNVENYLKECMESLINQTLKDIEIICVNDGSTDNSLVILEEYARKDSRIQIISKQNSGYGHTMNVGFSAAKGEYIGIVESDDYVLPDMFQQLYTLAKQQDVDVVKSNFYRYSKDRGLEFEEMLAGIEYDTVIYPQEYPKLFEISNPSIWSAIYRNAYIKEKNVTFHETPGASYQDLAFGNIAFASAKTVLCVKDAYLCYRVDNANSSVKSREKVFCIMDEFKRSDKFLYENGMADLLCKTEHNKFTHFMWNYFRVDDLFKYAFLLKMVEIFNEDDEKGLLDSSYWAESEWEKLQSIRADVTKFYKETCEEYRKKYILSAYTCGAEFMNNALKKELRSARDVIIYGAGKYGTKIYNDIKEFGNVRCFAVSDTEENAKDLQGVPVCAIEDIVEYKQSAYVIVAVKMEYQMPILQKLQKLGFENIISIYDNFEFWMG